MSIYVIPVVGPLIGIFFTIFLAIPFYFVWNAMAPKYFYWLPQVYHFIPFWDCVWLIVAIALVKTIFLPRFYSETTVKNGEKK